MKTLKEEPNFILTLRLKAETWQIDVLHKHMETGRKLNNACLAELYRRYNAMRSTRKYQEAINLQKTIPYETSSFLN